jgi:3-oxoadipate enol-lactonase
MGLTTTSDGCRIASSIEGPTEAAVVVLSSSLGVHRDMWVEQVAPLGRLFRVLRYDARGHGASDAPEGPYTLERLGRDVVELLDAHGVARAHFCGLSLGGLLGQWLGAHAPERIDRLVLASTAPRFGPPSMWDERIARVLEHGMKDLVDGTLERWLSPSFREREPEVVARIRAMFLSTSPVGYAGCCAALRDADLTGDLARIEAPTLLLAGANDPVTSPTRMEELSASFTNAPRLVTLDARHLTNVEQPEAFTQAVLGFLTRLQ